MLKLKSFELIFFIALAIFFSILISFKIHGSSIGMISTYFGATVNENSDLLFSNPRYIRSDEWLVLASNRVSNAIQNFPLTNPAIGLGQQTIAVSDSPSLHWKILFNPAMWPYFILQIEHAFSASWWFRAFILILSSYLLLKVFIDNKNYALLGAITFYFSPFLLWWNINDFLAYLFFSFYLFVITIENSKLDKRKILSLFGTCYFFICFFFQLYPPFQIPLLYALTILYTGFHYQKYQLARIKSVIRVMILIILVFITVVYFYTESFGYVIDAMRSTSYPGTRFEQGGEFPYWRLLLGFFDGQLQDDIKVSGYFTNQSEGSSFPIILFGLIIVIIVSELVKLRYKKPLDPIAIALILATMIILVYLIIGFPAWISSITLFSLVTAKRIIITLGVLNIIGSYYYLVKYKPAINTKLVSLVIGTIYFYLTFKLGNYLKITYPNFIQNEFKIVLISILAGLILLLFIQQKKAIAALLLLIFSISTSYRIQPLYAGLDPLLNSELSEELKKITANNDNVSFVVYDSNVYSLIIQANGVRALGGVHMYPQKNLWEILDPENDDVFEWNRYAHIIFSYVNGNFIDITNPQQDVVNVSINPCNSQFITLNVTHILIGRELNDSCVLLEKIVETPIPLYIYRISNND